MGLSRSSHFVLFGSHKQTWATCLSFFLVVMVSSTTLACLSQQGLAPPTSHRINALEMSMGRSGCRCFEILTSFKHRQTYLTYQHNMPMPQRRSLLRLHLAPLRFCSMWLSRTCTRSAPQAARRAYALGVIHGSARKRLIPAEVVVLVRSLLRWIG